MTVVNTTYFGLTAVRNEVPSANDWAATYWNWIIADEILYESAVNHKHDGASALASPTGTLSLSTAASGGTILAGVTYYVCVSYLDGYSKETGKSDYATITTPAAISAPSVPTYTASVDLVAAPGGLTGGSYWYKIAYKKGGGETTCSEPVYAEVPTGLAYSVEIHFTSLAVAANGADTIVVYRKIGTTGSWNKLADVVATSRDYYIDDNTGIPTCDVGPKTTNTTNSFNTITIDWSALDWENASDIKVYATTSNDGAATPGPSWVTESSQIVISLDSVATPVTSYTWTGTSRTAGRAPVISSCYPHPSKINLVSEVTGSLPWANLPSDFTWLQPVENYAALGTGTTNGEVKLTLDNNALYAWDDDTSAWVQVSGGGITRVVIPNGSETNDMRDYLPTTAIEDGDVCVVSTEQDNEVDNYGYRVGMFIYHANWSTPGWQRLNIVPVVGSESWSAPQTADDEGSLYLTDYYGYGTYWLSTANLSTYAASADSTSYTPLTWEEMAIWIGWINNPSRYYYNPTTLQYDFGWNGDETFADAFGYFGTDGICSYINLAQSIYNFDGNGTGTWRKLPTFGFLGVAASDAFGWLEEDDIYLEKDDTDFSDKIKRLTTNSTAKNLLTEAQSISYRDYADTLAGWVGIKTTETLTLDIGTTAGRYTLNGQAVIFATPGSEANEGIQIDLTNYPAPVTAGLDYVFSAYFRRLEGTTTNIGMTIKLEWFTAAKATISSTTSTFNIGASELRKSITQTAPGTAAYAIVSVYTTGTSALPNGYMWAAQFELGTTPTAWVPGGMSWQEIAFSKFRGVYSTIADLPSATDNDIAFVISDGAATPVDIECWYIYSGSWTQMGVKKSGTTIADISTDMSADANDNELKSKINTLIATLRTAKIITE